MFYYILKQVELRESHLLQLALTLSAEAISVVARDEREAQGATVLLSKLCQAVEVVEQEGNVMLGVTAVDVGMEVLDIIGTLQGALTECSQGGHTLAVGGDAVARHADEGNLLKRLRRWYACNFFFHNRLDVSSGTKVRRFGLIDILRDEILVIN